jgi:competence protein ComEC
LTRSSPLVAVVVGVLVVLAGCGGVADTTPTTADEPTDGQPTTAPAGSPGGTTASAPTNASGTLEVHFINVGQSVSTLLISPEGETMLIDSGDFTDDGEYVLQYLQRHDIERIDHFVVSHNDADHIGGNAAIIEYYETQADGIGAIYDPGIAAGTQTYGEYLDAVEQYDVPLYETREGDRIQFDGVSVDVLGPPEPYLASEARNENSIVLKITHGETSFLFTGDAEDDQEQYLVDEYGSQLQATVLKAGHHGSSSSTSETLLDAVDPSAVVVSSAYDSRYGHPTEEVLQRLADRSIPTYWTATHGDIVLVSDGTQVTVRTQQAGPTDPLALRNGDPIAPGTPDPVEPRATIDGDRVATVAPDGGTTTTSESGGQLAIETIHADAAGDDRDNLNDEYVVFTNTGDEPLDLSGWTVADEVGKTYTFPDGFTLDPGEEVTLHTGSGTDTATDLYWGASSPVWNNGGDTVIVTNADGERVLIEEYT